MSTENGKRRGRPRSINFLADSSQDFDVVLLAAYGYSNRHIQKQTGLTVGQIQERVKIAGIYRKDYRDGGSPIARHVFEQTNATVAPALRTDLSRKLAPKGGE